jgi:GNAT superfamily N-acetyltransferase
MEISLTVRQAAPEDAGLLAELGARTFADAFGADNTPEDMAAYLAANFSPERQREELEDPSRIFLIAEDEGRAVGYAQLRSEEPGNDGEGEGGSRLELVRLYATQDRLGRGVGAALMESFVRAGEEGGHDRLFLSVWEHNPRAIAFYRKWGFVETGTKDFPLGADLQTDLVMERRVRVTAP